jgi:hypothetical protein
MASDLRRHVWYEEALKNAAQIHDDAQVVHEQIVGDKAWEAGDR